MKNKLVETLLLLLFTSALLTIISFFPFHLIGFRSPDFLSEIKGKNSSNHRNHESGEQLAAQDSAFVEPTKLLADSSIISFGDLSAFFEALYSLHKKVHSIHVAYFGDSMIEGDLLTMDLRESLQQRFGGRGVGFMPITSATAGFRTSISHQFNENWTTYHFNKKPPEGIDLGWSGFSFRAQPGANARFKKSKSQDAFRRIELYYKSASAGKWSVKRHNTDSEIAFDATDAITTLALDDSIPFEDFSLKLIEGNPTVMGLNFEDGPGIYVDNYSFRGNSGVPQNTIKDETYQFASKQLNCKLVVLHYGLNVVGHEVGDYSWYLQSFRKTIQKFKRTFPKATIILSSVGDKSHKSGQQYHTESDIPLFVGMQAKLAREEGVVFWNLYQAMGGYDSMKRWVEEESPRKAAKDYTHFNHAGAKTVATLFYDWLMKEYEVYLGKKLSTMSNPEAFIAKPVSK
jgi:hypothetical protein